MLNPRVIIQSGPRAQVDEMGTHGECPSPSSRVNEASDATASTLKHQHLFLPSSGEQKGGKEMEDPQPHDTGAHTCHPGFPLKQHSLGGEKMAKEQGVTEDIRGKYWYCLFG